MTELISNLISPSQTVETKLTDFYKKVFTDLFDPIIKQIYIPEYEFPADKAFNIKNINSDKINIDEKNRQILLNNLAYGHFKIVKDETNKDETNKDETKTEKKLLHFKEMDNIHRKEAILFSYDEAEGEKQKLNVQTFDENDNEKWIPISQYIETQIDKYKSENEYENEDNEAITNKRTELTEHYETLEKIMDKFNYLF